MNIQTVLARPRAPAALASGGRKWLRSILSGMAALSIWAWAGAAAALAVVTVSPNTLPGGTVGTPYSQVLTASAGIAPYTFSVSAGALPAGLNLTAATATTITVSGTPTTASPNAFTIQASDSSTTTTCGVPPCPPNLPVTLATPVNGSQTYNVPIVAAASVPALAQWAMIGFALLLAGAGVAVVRRAA